MFDLTSMTGSLLYMAPEVFKGLPYNYKVIAPRGEGEQGKGGWGWAWGEARVRVAVCMCVCVRACVWDSHLFRHLGAAGAQLPGTCGVCACVCVTQADTFSFGVLMYELLHQRLIMATLIAQQIEDRCAHPLKGGRGGGRDHGGCPGPPSVCRVARP